MKNPINACLSRCAPPVLLGVAFTFTLTVAPTAEATARCALYYEYQDYNLAGPGGLPGQRPGKRVHSTMKVARGKTEAHSPPRLHLRLIRNDGDYTVSAQITKLLPGGVTSGTKWVKLEKNGATDPPLGSYTSDEVRLYNVKCH
jgi:hypothetical protein